MKKHKTEDITILPHDEYERKKFEAIGKRLRQIRREKGYSGLDRFAFEHDLQRTTYQKMEKGKGFQMASLIKVLRIFNMTFEEFFKDTNI